MTFFDMKDIETERLILRKIAKEDASDMYEYSKDPKTSEFLTWSPHESVSYTKKYIRFLLKKYKTGEYFDWAIEEKESGKFIGTCGFPLFDPENSKAEIGYVLNPSFWGRGYATEAVTAIVDYAFSSLKLHRLEARCMKNNSSSENVLKKCAFSLEGVFKDELIIKGEYKTISHFALLNPNNK